MINWELTSEGILNVKVKSLILKILTSSFAPLLIIQRGMEKIIFSVTLLIFIKADYCTAA